MASARTTLHVGGLHYASEKSVVERVLSRRPGVLDVDANPVAQTATVGFDPERTSVEELRRWVEECGFHCAGRSVPGHVCDPLAHEGDDAGPARSPVASRRSSPSPPQTPSTRTKLLRLVAAVERESQHPLAERAASLAGQGRTVVHVAVEGRAAGLLAIADAPRETAVEAVAALKELGIRPVMLTGDNEATAARVAAEVGIEEVLAKVLPGEKAAKVAALQAQGRRVAMVGDGVNDAPALAQADVGVGIGAGTDVAIETADVVLMRSDPLDVATAVRISRGTVRKMRQNLGWAIGYNSLALPVAAGVFEPFGFMLRPEIAAISMSGSSLLVAVNALALKRLRLPSRSSGTSESRIAA